MYPVSAEGDFVVLTLRVEEAEVNRQSSLAGSAASVLGGVSERETCVTRVLPLSSTEIAARAYSNNSRLLSVEFPDGLTGIGVDAFSHCSLREVRIPGSVSVISERAFFGCGRLQNIHLGEGVKRIECQAFANCGPMGSPILVDVPLSVTHIAYDAFERVQRTPGKDCVYIRTPINSYAYKWVQEHAGSVQLWNK